MSAWVSTSRLRRVLRIALLAVFLQPQAYAASATRPALWLAQAVLSPDAGTPASRPTRRRPRAQETSPDAGQPRGALTQEKLAHPILIRADTFSVNDRTRLTTWTSNVRATRGDTELSCDTLVAHYLASSGGTQPQVERIECEGHVVATRGETTVRGEHATFDNLSGLLVLTGNPSAQSGPNQMWGDEVRFHVEEDVVEVHPARTVFQSVPKGGALAQAAKPNMPVDIKSDTFKLENARREGTWSGKVRVKRGETRLACGRLVAQYTEKQELNALQCLNGVEAKEGTIWAKGQRADFEPEKDVVVVTGDPEAKDGPNHLRGSRVLLFPGQNRVEVEKAVTVFDVPREKAAAGGKTVPKP